MGLTLCVKNLQGTNVPPYIRFCGGLNPALGADFRPDAPKHVDALFEKHLQRRPPAVGDGEGRVDGDVGPAHHRPLHAHPAERRPAPDRRHLRPERGRIRRGAGAERPARSLHDEHPRLRQGRLPCDIVGHWLGGHEPGNFGLFHLGRERGVTTPSTRRTPGLRVADDGPRLAPLDSFARVALATPYLPKKGEPRFHICDEPFAYAPEPKSACLSGGDRPSLRALGEMRSPNGRTSLAVEYRLPAEGPACLEVYDSLGERVGVLAQGRLSPRRAHERLAPRAKAARDLLVAPAGRWDRPAAAGHAAGRVGRASSSTRGGLRMPEDPVPRPTSEQSTLDRAAPASAGSFGHYRLLQRLGEGGMGEAWLAEQTEPVRRQVALKVIKAGMDSAQGVFQRLGPRLLEVDDRSRPR